MDLNYQSEVEEAEETNHDSWDHLSWGERRRSHAHRRNNCWVLVRSGVVNLAAWSDRCWVLADAGCCGDIAVEVDASSGAACSRLRWAITVRSASGQCRKNWSCSAGYSCGNSSISEDWRGCCQVSRPAFVCGCGGASYKTSAAGIVLKGCG